MAWKKVESYSFGFSVADKKFWMYYTLQGSGGSATQVFLSATQFSALAHAFGAASGINYETTGKYFTTEPRVL